MELRKYKFKCYDPNGNYVTDMPITFPTFTPAEYTSLKNEYNSHDSKIVVYGQGNEEGSLTDLGSTILKDFNFQYSGSPVTFPTADDYKKLWWSLVSPHFKGLYDFTNKISLFPITTTETNFYIRNFTFNNNPNVSNKIETYSENISGYKYRRQTIGGGGGLNGCSYGSGSSSNTDAFSYCEFFLYFLTTDNKVGHAHFTGYYNTSPKGLKVELIDPTENPTNNNWFVPLVKNSSDYDVVDPTDTDPYKPAGNSTANGVGGGGGTGDFDDTSDTIGLPSIPTLSGLNTGFFTAFIPSASQMQSVSNYLWNNFLDDLVDPQQTIGEKVDALKKIVANPYDAIMGCSVIPVTPPTGGSKELKMYGLIETGITIPYASTRWVTVDCGTLNIHEFWGGYLDYSPYTKTTSLYLPYIGTVSIDIDLIMAKALQVIYRVDILSGICVAFILVDGSVKFHYQGQCATQIPITNADYSSVISAGIGLIGSASQVVGSAVTGGASGGPIGAVLGAVGGAVAQAPSIAGNVMGMKPDIRSGGSVGSSAGILSVQKPYLIIERPRQSLPNHQNEFTGYPSNIRANVGSLSGYTEFETINLDNLFLTDAEKEELTNILKGGVYL